MVATAARDGLGACRSVTITCVSETGWHDTATLLADIKAAGGPGGDQWRTGFDPDNAAGSCSLVEVTARNGHRRRFLLDAGWNPAYMEERFRATGLDEMLRAGAIEFLYLSHEHFDHLWGIEAVLRLVPSIRIVAPAGFRPEALALLQGADYPAARTGNAVAHRGELVLLPSGRLHRLMAGIGSATFDLPILLGVQGEQSLFMVVEGKGVVCVTGCCHQGAVALADYAREHVAGEAGLYGLYGGLHISPFGPLQPEGEATVKAIGTYGFSRIACNHCTGQPAMRMMAELGYPLVAGSGRFGSASRLSVGNGDSVTFG